MNDLYLSSASVPHKKAPMPFIRTATSMVNYTDKYYNDEDGNVRFPFTEDPGTDSDLRAQFCDHILSLNRDYKRELGYERWDPADYERLFQEFRNLYLIPELSPPEKKLEDWVNAGTRPDFFTWLCVVHRLDKSFKKWPEPGDQVDKNNHSIYRVFVIPNTSAAREHSIPYNDRGYPYSDFCLTSTPPGRRVPLPQFAEEDTTEFFTRPLPWKYPENLPSVWDPEEEKFVPPSVSQLTKKLLGLELKKIRIGSGIRKRNRSTFPIRSTRRPSRSPVRPYIATPAPIQSRLSLRLRIFVTGRSLRIRPALPTLPFSDISSRTASYTKLFQPLSTSVLSGSVVRFVSPPAR